MGNSTSSEAFKGKTVWVIGASSGIGAALAEAFHERGANVIVSARRVDALEGLVQKLSGSRKGVQVSNAGVIAPTDGLGRTNPATGAAALAFDAADLNVIAEMTQNALKIFNGIDVLCMCQGISNRGTVMETDISVEKRLFDVNVFSYFALAKSILPHFCEKKSGRIIVTSSVQGFFGLPSRAPYSSSKHALHGYFESLRAEVAHKGIHVNVLCPGYVKTELSLNALTTDASSKHNQLDATTAGGFEPSYFAERAIKGILKDKEYIVVAQTSAVVGIWLKYHIPSLLSWLMKKKGRKEALANESKKKR